MINFYPSLLRSTAMASYLALPADANPKGLRGKTSG